MRQLSGNYRSRTFLGGILKLFDFLELEEPVQIVDIGASAINEKPIYKILLDKRLGHLNAFEGDERQIDGIKNAYGGQVTIFQDFLYDGKNATVYLMHPDTGMTSLLPPKNPALRFFNGFEGFGRVVNTFVVQTKRLDDVPNLPTIDFLKMDIQGAELTVLQNGPNSLRNCVAIQLEVSFVNLYENQPSFGDLDLWMRSNGYVPHTLIDLKRWSITPTIFNNNFRIPGNQLLEADIVYIRDPLDLHALTSLQLKKLVALSHYCFGSIDLCVFLLLELERRVLIEKDSHKQYLTDLSSLPHMSVQER
jgi:FkbM family methyltransferase